jgi:lysozyme family protein
MRFSMPNLQKMEQGYINLWNTMSILDDRRHDLENIIAKLASGQPRYEAVETETGVPWWFAAIIHMRESSCDFTTYLGNGEPLSRKTRLVPVGRGPFESWQEGAVDALRLQGYANLEDWGLPAALYRFEAYNGWGYLNHKVNSPYVWSWTSHQQPGKYVADGKWSPTALDVQPGCAAMLRGLIDAGHVTIEDTGKLIAAVDPDTKEITINELANLDVIEPTEKSMLNIFSYILPGIGSLISGMLSSNQLSSLWRKGLLAAAVAILSKYGVADPQHLVEVIGAGVLGISSVAGSIKAHMEQSNQSLNDTVNEAVQTAVAAALPAAIQALSSSKEE